jgi:hypothetical protein
MKIADAAKHYLSLGMSIIPLVPHDKFPYASVLKETTGSKRWGQFAQRAATWGEAEDWFRQPANVGIVTGQVSRVIVLDVDDLDAAMPTLSEMGIPAGAAVARTGGGGLHIYMAHPCDGQPIPNFAKRMPGADLRGDGGYVVAPPSIHSSGTRYAWLVRLPAEIASLPCAPEWLITLARAERSESNGNTDGVTLINGFDETAPWGNEQHNAATERQAQKARPIGRAANYAARVLELEVARVYHAVPPKGKQKGSRNDALNIAAFNLGTIMDECGLSQSEIEQALLQAALGVGLKEREARATILSGLTAGAQRPRRLTRANWALTHSATAH